MVKNFSKYFLLYVFLLIHSWISAQSLSFENISVGDGISNSQVCSIGQDKYGFIWIGTKNGLNIYDGINFKQYYSNINDLSSLSGNHIEDMVFDDDSVWIATRTGLCKMDIKTKKCKRYSLKGNSTLRTLFLEKDGKTLWIGSASGLIRMDTKTGMFRVFNTENSNISSSTVRSIYRDNDDNLWIGTFDKLNVLRANSDYFETINLKKRQQTNIKYNLVLSIQPNQSNNDSLLWIGTETGLIRYNRFSEEMDFFHEENSGLPNSVIKTMIKSQSGDLWLGTDFGLGRLDESNKIEAWFHDLNDHKSLINNIVWDIFEDNSGTLWFGTNNGISILSRNSGRFRFFPVTFKHDQNVIGYEINDVIETADGNYWIASENGAIKYNDDLQIIDILNSEQEGERKLTDYNVTDVFEDSEGNIWIASNGGIAIWNEEKEILTRYSADNSTGRGLRSNWITSFFQLADGTVLINTQEGLHKVNQSGDEIKFEVIHVFNFSYELSGNFLWSGIRSNLYKTSTAGFERKLEKTFTADGKYLQILSILFTDDKNLWLGESNGLIHYNLETKTYDYYEIKSNRKFPIISLLNDAEGNIWASSYSAILKFSLDTEDFEIYPSGNEIAINRFNRDCACRNSSGDMIFGGQDGFIRFSPQQITKSDFISPVVFTKLVVSNSEVLPGQLVGGKELLKSDIAFTESIDLYHENKSFSLEFSSLHFGNREAMRYAYRLDGLDDDWNYINGQVGIATYTNLKAGNYVLKVKGTNREGVWNQQVATLNIRIRPPLWASSGFIILYFSLLVMLVLSMILYSRNRLKVQNKLQVAELENKHAHELVKSRQQFFANISHEFQTPLSLIVGPAKKLEEQKELSAKSREYVRIIDNNARRLLWLNNQLVDFRKLEANKMKMSYEEFNLVEFIQNIFELFADKAERKNIAYYLHTDLDELTVQMDLRKVETILFNLLSNAFKFTSKNGQITLKMETAELRRNDLFQQAIAISVVDSGIGIPKDDQTKIFERFYQTSEASKMQRGSGIGLTLVKEYVDLHEGEIGVESEPGKGSDFRVLLPLYPEKKVEKKDKIHREGGEHEEDLLKAKTYSTILSNTTQSSIAPSILLIEDDEEILEFICLGFNNKYKIRVARNGREALALIAQETPSLVISDIVMPEMDGIEFTRLFKSNPKTAHIPLILLTGQLDIKTQMEGLKSGADAYITKPFEFELLEVRVDNFLKRQKQFLNWLKVQKLSKPNDFSIATKDEKLLEKVVASIEKFISDPDLSIEKVCADTGFSHSMLYRKIKQLTGHTLNEFIRKVRVQRAEQLLRTKKFSVAEVMYETGFTNHSYFSKSFRKVYNVSPKEYIEKV